MIIRLLRGLGHTALGVVALAASAAAQGAPNQPASNPACVRLESQLAAINSGSTDPTRADQVKRAEDAVAKQQADLDRTRPRQGAWIQPRIFDEDVVRVVLYGSRFLPAAGRTNKVVKMASP